MKNKTKQNKKNSQVPDFDLKKKTTTKKQLHQSEFTMNYS